MTDTSSANEIYDDGTVQADADIAAPTEGASDSHDATSTATGHQAGSDGVIADLFP